jgi:preprotein translocase subunit SecE
MSSQTNTTNSSLDWFKWLIVAVIVAAGVYGNYYFAEQSLLYRVLALLALAIVALLVSLTTAKGREYNQLRKEAWVEVRKVVWPTKQETTQTTLVVVGVVVVVALILWAIDTLLGLVVSWVIG